MYKGNTLFQFFIENKALTLTGDTKNTAVFSLNGSASQMQWLAFSTDWNRFQAEFLTEKGVWGNLIPDSLWFSFQDKAETHLSDYFSRYPPKSIAGFMLLQCGSPLSPEVKQVIWKKQSKQAKRGQYGKAFAAILENETRFLTEPIRAFTWKDANGNTIQNTDLAGKYYLIEFWAAWCKPCRVYNQTLKGLYSETKRTEFEILSFSLDTDSALFAEALRQDAMPWTQVHDPSGWESVFVKYYKIQSIPSNLLVNPEGKIIAKNVKPERLRYWLKP